MTLKHRAIAFALFVVPFLQGCVAPGSSIGSAWVRGTVVSEDEAPIRQQQVYLLLPAAYGLGGLDLVMNEPEDFGHEDEWFSLETDNDGDFEQDLGTRVYHVNCWILPPVGCYPKAPPAPVVLIRLEASPHESYAIHTGSGEYQIFSKSGETIDLKDSRLSGVSVSSRSEDRGQLRSTYSTIRLRVRER